MADNFWNPNSPEVKAAIAARIQQMTPKEAMDFLEAGAEGLEQTDVTGHFPIQPPRPTVTNQRQRRSRSVKMETAA